MASDTVNCLKDASSERHRLHNPFINKKAKPWGWKIGRQLLELKGKGRGSKEMALAEDGESNLTYLIVQLLNRPCDSGAGDEQMWYQRRVNIHPQM